MKIIVEKENVAALNRTIGENVVHYRKRKGMSRQALAEAAEISVNGLGNIENGRMKHGPSLASAQLIAKALDVTVNHLIRNRCDEPENTDNSEEFLNQWFSEQLLEKKQSIYHAVNT